MNHTHKLDLALCTVLTENGMQVFLQKRVEGNFQLSGVHNSTQSYINGQVYLNAEQMRRPFKLTPLVR